MDPTIWGKPRSRGARVKPGDFIAGRRAGINARATNVRRMESGYCRVSLINCKSRCYE